MKVILVKDPARSRAPSIVSKLLKPFSVDNLELLVIDSDPPIVVSAGNARLWRTGLSWKSVPSVTSVRLGAENNVIMLEAIVRLPSILASEVRSKLDTSVNVRLPALWRLGSETVGNPLSVISHAVVVVANPTIDTSSRYVLLLISSA